jgi:uncharacterized membrane protein
MWVNHHHFIDKARHADAALLWSNNLLLFWMSLIPFVTANLGENHAAPLAVACYGAVFALTSAAFLLFQITIDRQDRANAARRREFLWMKRKAVFSMVSYAASVGLAFVSVHVALGLVVLFPALYFWPEGKARAGAK